MGARAVLVAGVLLALARVALAQVDPYTVAASQGDVNDVRVILVAASCMLAWALGFVGGNHE